MRCDFQALNICVFQMLYKLSIAGDLEISLSIDECSLWVWVKPLLREKHKCSLATEIKLKWLLRMKAAGELLWP